MGTTLVTGAGLVGTSFGQWALKRGESLVFFDPQPRQDFLQMKLGKGNFQVVQKDVRDLPALIDAIKIHKAENVVHTAGLIGPRVAESLYTGFHINVVGTMNVAEAVRLTASEDWSTSAPSVCMIGAIPRRNPLMRIFIAAAACPTATRRSQKSCCSKPIRECINSN